MEPAGSQQQNTPFPGPNKSHFGPPCAGEEPGPRLSSTEPEAIRPTASSIVATDAQHAASRPSPSHRAYARTVIKEGFGPASDYPFGPFPSDHLTYKSKEIVEFTTPARQRGLGTMSWLLPSDQSITGFALLSIGPNVDTELLQLSLRLPPSLSHLGATLIQQAEANGSS